MSLPRFDPWRLSKRPPTRAYRAYCAYPVHGIGTIGTIGTGAESIFKRHSEPEMVDQWTGELEATKAACDDRIEREWVDAAIERRSPSVASFKDWLAERSQQSQPRRSIWLERVSAAVTPDDSTATGRFG